jgi:hypothetical protein
MKVMMMTMMMMMKKKKEILVHPLPMYSVKQVQQKTWQILKI